MQRFAEWGWRPRRRRCRRDLAHEPEPAPEPAPADSAAPPDPADPVDPAAPADAGDAPAGDSADDTPDPAGNGAVAVEGITAEAPVDAAVEGDAVAGDDGPVETENGVDADSGVAESDVADSGVAENGVDVVATPDNSGTIGIAVPEAVLDGLRAPLTGKLTSDPNLAERRALAVKVGNGGRRDRPQAGLAAADIVYENLIEGGEGRFLAVFHSETPSRIGPVRSVRTSDFDLLADLSRPYLASSGANVTVLSELPGRQGGNYRRRRRHEDLRALFPRPCSPAAAQPLLP